MNRLVLAVAAAAVAASVVPAVAAAGCPTGFYHKGSGVISPLSGREITYCWPTPPPVV